MCGNGKDKIYLSVFLCQTKLNKEIFIFNKLSKQTDLKGQHNFILFHLILILYVADSATFLASNSVLWTLISTENSLFIPLWKTIFLSLYYCIIKIVDIKILSLNFFSKSA